MRLAKAIRLFLRRGSTLACPNLTVNDVTVIGLDEPQAYVRDYFVGDGVSRGFYLSQTPFQQGRIALIDEQYTGPGLDASTWSVERSFIRDFRERTGASGEWRNGTGWAEYGSVHREDRNGWCAGVATWGHHLRGSFKGSAGGLVRRRYFRRGMPGGLPGHALRGWVEHSGSHQWIGDRADRCDDGRSPLYLDDLHLFDGGLPIDRDLSFLSASRRERLGRSGGAGECEARAGIAGH